MRFITITELKNEASAIVHHVEEGDPVIVLRHGRPRAAVVPLKSSEDIDQLLFETSPTVHRILKESLKDLRAGRTVTLRQYLRGKRSR